MSRKYTGKTFPKFQPQDIDGQNALGVVVICSLEAVKENRTELAKKMQEVGINPEGIIEAKKPKTAFIDALKSLEDAKILLKVEDTQEFTTYQTNNSTKVPGTLGLELEVNKTALVRLYKKGPRAGEVESDVPGVGEKIATMLEEEKNIARTRDVSSFIRKLIDKDADAVNLTPAGVSWFFQPGYYTLITQLEALVGKISGTNFFQVFPLGNTDKNRGTYWKSITGELEKELTFIDNRISEAQAKLNAGEEPIQMLKNLLEVREEKKARLEAYADLFQLQSEELKAKLESQENNIRDLLVISEDAKVVRTTAVATPAPVAEVPARAPVEQATTPVQNAPEHEDTEPVAEALKAAVIE